MERECCDLKGKNIQNPQNKNKKQTPDLWIKNSRNWEWHSVQTMKVGVRKSEDDGVEWKGQWVMAYHQSFSQALCLSMSGPHTIPPAYLPSPVCAMPVFIPCWEHLPSTVHLWGISGQCNGGVASRSSSVKVLLLFYWAVLPQSW